MPYNLADNERGTGGRSEEIRDGDESGRYMALGSDSRMRILQELSRGERSVSELARSVGLHPVTVRYHINLLLKEGLIERMPRRREGVVGRPTTRFRLRGTAPPTTFPPRRYDLLSEILLQTICESLGEGKWEPVLYAAGRRTGKQLVEFIQEKYGVPSWDPRTFVRAFLEGGLVEMGVQATTTELDEGFVRYRMYVCPFQELALKYPEKVCDHLDDGFHDGVAEGMGPDVVHEKLRCMGHGDPYCEYVVRWVKALQEAGD